MASISDPQLLSLIAQYLPDNTAELITPATLRELLDVLVAAKVNQDQLSIFAQLASPVFSGAPQVPTAPAGTATDQVASTGFVSNALAGLTGRTLSELVLPQAVRASSWYLTGNGIWEPRRDFTASAEPVNGANWRLLASFAGQLSTILSTAITDASVVGRRMLTAPTAAAQRLLVNNPGISYQQYGNHPAFATEDGPLGAWKWVIQSILALQTAKPPAAPTAGEVNDVGDTFSFLPTPGYLVYAQYKVVGLPGTTGSVAFDATNSYMSSGRIFLKVVGSVPKNGLVVFVAGSGNVPDGLPLTNDEAFTGPVVLPNTPPVVTLTVAGTAAVPRFTAKATDADGIKSIGVNVYTALDDELVATFGPSVAGNTQYVTTWAAASAGDYYAQAVASDTKDLVGQSDQVPFSVTAATVTPDAPVVVYNSTARTLSVTPTPAGTVLFSYQGSAFLEYVGAIQVDSAAHDPQEWRFKRAASAGYAESGLAYSPAIAAASAAGASIVPVLADWNLNAFDKNFDGTSDLRSHASYVEYDTAQNTVDVTAITTIKSAWPTQGGFSAHFVNADKSLTFIGSYKLASNNTSQVFTIALPGAGTRRVRFTLGALERPGDTGNVLGTLITLVKFPASSVNYKVAATIKPKVMVVLHDSIIDGLNTDSPEVDGVIPQYRLLDPDFSVISIGWGGRKLSNMLGNELATVKGQVALLVAGATEVRFYIEGGTNDGNNGVSASTITSTVSSALDSLQASYPGVTFFVQTPTATKSSEGNMVPMRQAITSGLSGRNEKCQLVDGPSLADPVLTTDGTHYDKAGNKSIANNMYGRIYRTAQLAGRRIQNTQMTFTGGSGTVNTDPSNAPDGGSLTIAPGGGGYGFNCAADETQVRLGFHKETSGGVCEIFLNGQHLAYFSQYVDGKTTGNTFTTPVFAASSSNVITVRQYGPGAGNYYWIDYADLLVRSVSRAQAGETLQVDDPRISYGPSLASWNFFHNVQVATANYIMAALRYQNGSGGPAVAGGEIRLPFTGRGVQLDYHLEVQGTEVEVLIDGVVVDTFNQYNADQVPDFHYLTPQVAEGDHVVVFRPGPNADPNKIIWQAGLRIY